jgi:hypothetical protein
MINLPFDGAGVGRLFIGDGSRGLTSTGSLRACGDGEAAGGGVLKQHSLLGLWLPTAILTPNVVSTVIVNNSALRLARLIFEGRL